MGGGLETSRNPGSRQHDGGRARAQIDSILIRRGNNGVEKGSRKRNMKKKKLDKKGLKKGRPKKGKYSRRRPTPLEELENGGGQKRPGRRKEGGEKNQRGEKQRREGG